MNFLKINLFFLLLFPTLLFAQNYKPGYIVNLKGDTTRGYIDLKEWQNNPKNIYFKSSLDNSTLQTLTAHEIIFFEISDITAYRTFTASISLDETNLQKLENHRDTTTKTELVFMKVLQTGNYVTLYSYADDLKDRYYIYENKSKVLKELVYRIYFVDNEKNNVTAKTQEEYKQQLLLIAQQYSTYSEKIKNLLVDANYLNSDLTAVCRIINNSKLSNKKGLGNKGKYIGFFGGTGLAYSIIKSGGNFPINAPNNTSNSISPFIDAGVNFYPVPEVGASLIRVEFMYSKVKFKMQGVLYYNYPTLFEIYTFDQSNFIIYPQFQYNLYNTEKLKLFVNVGILYNISQYTNNIVHIPSQNDDQYYDPGFFNSWFSIPFKAGIILKKHFEFSLSYTIPTFLTISQSKNNSVGPTSFFIQSIKMGLNYNF